MNSIDACSINDTVGEMPHSLLGKVRKHAQGCSFMWASSTVRLNPSLDLVEKFPEVATDVFFAGRVGSMELGAKSWWAKAVEIKAFNYTGRSREAYLLLGSQRFWYFF